jgi:hypothetical protein
MMGNMLYALLMTLMFLFVIMSLKWKYSPV